jgi:hypothetical protein
VAVAWSFRSDEPGAFLDITCRDKPIMAMALDHTFVMWSPTRARAITVYRTYVHV